MRHQQKSGGKIALNLGKKLFLKIGGEVSPLESFETMILKLKFSFF